VDSSLPLTLTDRPASFSVAQSLFEIHRRLQLQHKAATVNTRQSTHCSRDKHLARPDINKKK